MLRLVVLPLVVASLSALAQDVHVRVSPDVKTGIEGTTEFPTIQMALDHHPFPGPHGRVFLEIAPGTYRERIIVTQNHPRITLIGTGRSPADVVITNSLNAKTAGGTFFTETAEINGADFEADNVTFENTAGNTGQAVAAAVRSDRAIFKHCRFLGHQDTLFADYGRQYYVDSYIEGGVDFIFGNATAIFDHTELHSNGPGSITAQSRTAADQTTGYVIVDSTITADAGHTLNLGRPWRPYARVLFLRTALPATLDPSGWNNWGKTSNEATAYYGEFANTGPGAETAGRVPWAHPLSAAQARQYLPKTFLGGPDHWDPVMEAARLP